MSSRGLRVQQFLPLSCCDILRLMTTRALLLFLVLSLSLAGMQSEPFAFKVVATGLLNPWEVAYGPDANLWVTERTEKRSHA